MELDSKKQKGEGITGLASTAFYEKEALLATPLLEFEASKFLSRVHHD